MPRNVKLFTGSLKGLRERQNLVAGVPASLTAKDERALRRFDESCHRVEVGFARPHARGVGKEGLLREIGLGLLVQHVAGHGNHAHSLLYDGGLERGEPAHRRRLGWRGGGLAVTGALPEDQLRVRLLKVLRTDELRRYLTGDGEDGRPVALSVVEAIDQVEVSWTASAGASGGPTGQLSVGARSERRYLLVTGSGSTGAWRCGGSRR